MQVTLKQGGKTLATGTAQSDGTIVLQTKGAKIEKSSVLTLTIANKGQADVAMVILNHNTRR